MFRTRITTCFVLALAQACAARLRAGDGRVQVADVISGMLPGSKESPGANAKFELITVDTDQFHNLSTANDKWEGP